MAKLRIKRSTGSTAPNSTDLANAELAFTEGNDILFYGEGTSGSNAASVIKIGGSGAFMALEGAQTVGGNKTFSNDVVVTGNLTVNGTTTTVSTTNTTISDNILELNSGAGSNSNDCGIMIERGSTGNNAFIGWDESADQFILGTTTAAANSVGDLSVTAGTIQANVTGSATQLANTRTFSLTGDVTGSQTFNGTGDAAIAATIASGAVERDMLNLISTSSAPGLTVKGDSTTDGYLQLNCSQNSHGIKLSSPPHSAGQSYTLTFPSSVGSSGQVLSTSGSGNLTWSTPRTDEQVQDIVGAMFSSNTETGITATYQDSDGTIDLVIGTLNQDTTGNAATATTSTKVTVTDNESTNENNLIAFVADAATSSGSQALEMDGDFSYNPSTGILTVPIIDGGTF
jgi:hypothetical protein|tara:strand:- start:583 stop:1782 length:1200 start_codon:yes stop_codon:yes gene_type:complete